MSRPNILVILNDDMGYSDLGCYGGEVQTPNLDRLAANGLRFTQFYNTARCCPTRASLLTGLHPHQASVGHMMDDLDYDGYRGDLNMRSVTIAEALKSAGYATYMSGKWHISRHIAPDGPNHSWPRQRGFDRYFGILGGAAHYWNPQTLTRDNTGISVDELPEDFFLTDAISDQAADYVREHAQSDEEPPFFLYTAYTSPHWPLHAHEEDIEKYKGRFAAGWDQLREERIQRMREMGILKDTWPLSERDASQVPWEEAEHKEWQQRRMEVYAAQIDRMDQGIGRILEALEETGQMDNTLIMFLADNGGCAEELGSTRGMNIAHPSTRDGRPVMRENDPSVMPGPEETYQSYGVPWANVSNTPFRRYKHWTHEGGISTPLIVHWPDQVREKGVFRHQPGQLTDIMATCLEVAGAEYPETYNNNDIFPLEGTSLVPIFSDQDNGKDHLIWEHEGNCAVRKGKWKLVRYYPSDWELYDIEADRTELNDLAEENPEVVAELEAIFNAWAERCPIQPWDNIIARRGQGRRPSEVPPEMA
ncbi:MAG: sulfatase-like hydrolase/transferase [bacterium]|nr:sulfatase-like hydrolase/transferase [bacterium]